MRFADKIYILRKKSVFRHDMKYQVNYKFICFVQVESTPASLMNIKEKGFKGTIDECGIGDTIHIYHGKSCNI